MYKETTGDTTMLDVAVEADVLITPNVIVA